MSGEFVGKWEWCSVPPADKKCCDCSKSLRLDTGAGLVRYDRYSFSEDYWHTHCLLDHLTKHVKEEGLATPFGMMF